MSHHTSPDTGDPCFRRATYHISEKNKDGEWTTGHLCDVCAKQYLARIDREIENGNAKSTTVDFVNETIQDEKNKLLKDEKIVKLAPGTLIKFLVGLVSLQNTREVKHPRSEKTPCPECGQGFHEILRDHQVGCRYCFDHFREELATFMPFLTPPRKSEKTKKRRVVDIEKTESIPILEAEMAKVVAKEDYHTAAKIRDRIKQLREDSGGL